MERLDALRSQELGSNNSLRRTRQDFIDKENATDTKTKLHPAAAKDPVYKKLVTTLTAWVNSYVIQDQLGVRDLISDMSDGYILIAFIEKLTNEKVPSTVDGASEKARRINVTACVKFCEYSLNIPSKGRFTIDGILNKDYTSILCLLVDLVHAVGCPYVLPSNLSIAVMNPEDVGGVIKNKTTVHQITKDEQQYSQSRGIYVEEELFSMEDLSRPVPLPDAFDKLFDDRNKVTQVTTLIRGFVNQKFEGMDMAVDDLALEFHDGVYLILLVGTMGHFFVPLNFYHLAPKTAAEKLENVRTAFKLMGEMGISTTNFNAVDLVRRDLKGTLRCLYTVFTHYSNKNNA
ncbi:hypothetical protein SmJEL517_g00135 [Synchytrium microbalum]|uniref:Calponin-homology (CH) domain-containing protein n=1 Tax=Synchytrium microbalum TaxID=1806994 RepID=A0A507CJ63_9FUNG|nr:uncharacterized protein SmJEL517_g00135 [Synchytrium microbalum]TPX38306.1 hypothetical protein SmJEL517_g00135 [Synchytrium microbalum]